MTTTITRTQGDGTIDFIESEFPDTINVNDGIQWRDQYGVFLTWDLSELIFHNDELEAAEVQRRLEDSRTKIIERVTGYYYELYDALRKLENYTKADRQDTKRNYKTNPEIVKLLSLSRLNALTDDYVCRYLEHATTRTSVNGRKRETRSTKYLPYTYKPPQNDNDKDPMFPYDEGALR